MFNIRFIVFSTNSFGNNNKKNNCRTNKITRQSIKTNIDKVHETILFYSVAKFKMNVWK